MTVTFLRPAALAALFAVLAPAPARAQLQTKMGGQTPVESLTAQEQEMLAVATEFSKRCGQTLEKWISSKETTQEKLFSSLYYPVAKTDPPKFTTDWDRLADRDIQAIEEAALARSPVMIYAVMVDRYGYLPTHNVRYSQQLTGNLAMDLVNNRTKRIFNDRTGIAAARSVASFLIQRYQRDTGEVMADLSVPVMVAGSHWGAVRLGYRALDAAGQAVPIPAAARR
jgi:methyl-accepting chemotaxis protein